MSAASIVPTTWHVAPNKEGPCEICGCWKGRGEHRAVAPDEGKDCRWMGRKRTDAGNSYTVRINDPPLAPPATKWHYRPNRSGPCEVCGCWKVVGKHRAIVYKGDRPCGWLIVKRTEAGNLTYQKVGETPRRRKPASRPGRFIRPHVPTKRVIEKMTRAIYLIVAGGKTQHEAAETMKINVERIHDWRSRWAVLWQQLTDQTSAALVDAIRATAGTATVLDDPDGYLRRAAAADKWAAANGVELFPRPTGEMTLTHFFHKWYLPQRLFDARLSTKEQYTSVVKGWRLLTGDPPAERITPEVIARFREARAKMRGLKPHLPASPNTVRAHMRVIQILLDKMGPPGRGNRDGLGVLERVPWAPPPRAVEKIPRTIDPQRLSDCYLAAVGMEHPQFAGVKPPAFWRSLLVMAWNTGLRRGTLFSMRFDEVDWSGNRLVLPADQMKSRRPLVLHLNAAAIAALRAVRTEREFVFRFSASRWALQSYFSKLFHRLQDLAGIPRADHFGLHDIRRTVATTLWEENPAAAQFALAHASNDLTRRHYVDGGPLVARAFDALPQPTAFMT